MKVLFYPAKPSSLVKTCKVQIAKLRGLCLDCHDALDHSCSDVPQADCSCGLSDVTLLV